MRAPTFASLALAGAALFALAAPAAAQWRGGAGGFGRGGWGGDPYRSAFPERDLRRDRSSNRDGEVTDVARFRAEGIDPAALGRGAIVIAPAPQALDEADQARFEAAVIDRLVAAGYDTAAAQPEGGQVAEVRVIREEAAPAEAPRKPVSGAMEVGVGTYGTSTALALSVDLSRPRGALLSTRLEVRIRDRASGNVLWEGRAVMLTRAGESKWSGDAVPRKLAKTLFDDFPAAAS